MKVMAKKPKRTKTTPEFMGMGVVDNRLVGLNWETESDKAISGLNVNRKWMKKSFVYNYDEDGMTEYNELQEAIEKNQEKQQYLLNTVGQMFDTPAPSVKEKPSKKKTKTEPVEEKPEKKSEKKSEKKTGKSPSLKKIKTR